jgi:hypothetical protein
LGITSSHAGNVAFSSRELELGDSEDCVVSVKSHGYFPRLRCLPDDLDEIDGLAGHQKVPVASSFDGLRVKDMAVRSDGHIFAKLEKYS